MRIAPVILVLGLAASLLASGQERSSPPSPRPFRVVVLNDGDSGLPAFQLMDRALRSVLRAPGRPPIDIYAESLDTLRFPEGTLDEGFAALFGRKYRDLPVDVVVAIGDGSLRFAEKHRAQLWPGAYLIFQGLVGDMSERRFAPRTSGWGTRNDIAGIADLALRLRPGTRRLIVVSGTGNYDVRLAGVAKEQLADAAKRLAIEHWERVDVDALARRLAALAPHDAVIYVGISRDATGRRFQVADATNHVSAPSKAPVYGHLETMLGNGIVGGTMYSFESRGARTGEAVLAVLQGGSLPTVLDGGSSTCVVDARQLERWGMDESRLPAGCEIRFPLPSLWREYRWHVLGALAVIFAQAALIAALVWQRRARGRAETEARQRRAELAQAGRLALAGELTASIAHEINQPLGSILANAGAAEALLRRDPGASEELKAILADIRSADQRASEIIRRVRALVTTRQAEPERIEARAIVEEALAILRPEADRRRIAVDAGVEPGLPPLMVDRIQAHQAIVNLCINAMEAMDDCPPERRRLGLRATKGGDRSVRFIVSDTGPGILQAHMPHLFDSFFTTKENGTGLGLSITRSIAEAHGGSVGAENRAGAGAVFILTLPAAEARVST
jgi:signal transduction histidine kinase